MKPESSRIRVAAAFLLLSGLLNAAQAVGVEAAAGFSYPADLTGLLLRVAVCVLLSVGLIRGVRLAWWGSLLIGAVWWLQSSMTVVAMSFLSGSLIPDDTSGLLFLGTWIALSATLPLLLIAGPGARSEDPTHRLGWSLPSRFGPIGRNVAIVALLLSGLVVWWFSQRLLREAEEISAVVYDTVSAILPAQEIMVRRRGSDLTIETPKWMPIDSPPGNRLREARAIGRATRATYPRFAELSGVTVTFNVADSAFVAPFTPGQLAPEDSSDVMTFTFKRVQ